MMDGRIKEIVEQVMDQQGAYLTDKERAVAEAAAQLYANEMVKAERDACAKIVEEWRGFGSGKDTQPSEPSASAVRDAAKAVVDDAIIHTEPGQTQCRWCSEVFDADNNKHFKGCTIGALQSALKGREE